MQCLSLGCIPTTVKPRNEPSPYTIGTQTFNHKAFWNSYCAKRQSVYPPTLFGSAPDAGCHTEFGKRSLSGGTKPLPGSTIPPGCGGSGPVLAP